MSLYHAGVRWTAEGDFASGAYSRQHQVVFDGASFTGSASPHVVPLPYADPAAVDPEEMFVASLSSCHMLWFLDLARRAGVLVDRYEDDAEGELAKDARGRMVMTRVILRPRVTSNAAADVLAGLHHQAHERCYIANSVTTEVVVEPA